MSRHAATTLLYRPGEASALARALVATSAPAGEVAGVPSASLAEGHALLSGAREKGGDHPSIIVVLGRPSLADSGAAVVEAASILAGLPGVSFLSALRRSNVHGALDMGLAPGVLPGRVGLEAGRAWFEQAWGTSLPSEAGRDATGVLTEASEGRLQSLVLLGADPLADFPDRTLAKRALDGAGFVVAVDCFLTESSARADVILPAATYAERGGTMTNLEGRVARLGHKVTRPGVAWPDWMIASELAFRLGGDLGFDNLEDIWDEIERVAPSHRGATARLLGSRAAADGVVVPLAPGSWPGSPGTGRPGGGPAAHDMATDAGAGVEQAVPAPIDPMADPGIGSAETHGIPATAIASQDPAAGEVHAPSGEGVVSGSTVGAGAVASGEGAAGASGSSGSSGSGSESGSGTGSASGAGSGSGGPGPVEPQGTLLATGPSRPRLLRFEAPGAGESLPKLDSYSLRLIAARSLWDNGTLLRHSPNLAALHPPQRLRVNPYDLDRLGVASGGQVRVISPRASLVLDVLADPGVPKGSASLTFNLPGEGPGDLIDAAASVTDVRLETV